MVQRVTRVHEAGALKARSLQEFVARAGAMADFVETDSPLPTPTLQRKSARMSATGEGECAPPPFVRKCCVRKKASAEAGSADARAHKRKARKKERPLDACVATSYRSLAGSDRGAGDACNAGPEQSPKRRKSGDADSLRGPRTPVPAGEQSPRKVAKYGPSRAGDGEGEEARPVANGWHRAKHKELPDAGRPNGDAGRVRMRRRSEEQHSALSGTKKRMFRSIEALDAAVAAARLDGVAEHRDLAGERYTTRSGESSEDTDSEPAVVGVSYKPINVSGECWRFVGDGASGEPGNESSRAREERLNGRNLAKGGGGAPRERRRWNSNQERRLPDQKTMSALWSSFRQEDMQHGPGEIRDGTEDVGTEAMEASPRGHPARTEPLSIQPQFARRTADILVQTPIVRREWKRLSTPLVEGNAAVPSALNAPGRRLPSRASRTRWSMFADMDLPRMLAQQKDSLGQMRYGEIFSSIQMPRKASLGVEEGREVTEAKFSPVHMRLGRNRECTTGETCREGDEKENSPLRNQGKTNYGRRSLRDVEEVLEAARAFPSVPAALNSQMEGTYRETVAPSQDGSFSKFALKSALDRNEWKRKGGRFSFDRLVHVCSETVAQSIRQCIAESPDEVPANVKDLGLERGAAIIGDMIKEFVATLPSDVDKEGEACKGEGDAESEDATPLAEDMAIVPETKDDDDDDGKDTPTSPSTPPPDEIREALLDDDEAETIKDSSSPRTSQDICDDNTSGEAPGGVRISGCGSAFVLPSFKKLEEPKVVSRRGSLDAQESSRIRLSKTGKIEVVDASEVGDEPDPITEEGGDRLDSEDEGRFQDSVSSQQEGPDAPSARRSSFTERFNLWRMSWKYKNDSQPPSRSESLKIRLMQRRASGSEFSMSYDSVRRSMSGNLNDLFSGGGQRRASTVETPRLARRNSEQKASYPRRGSLTNLIFRSASDTSASQRFNVDDRLRKINKMDKASVERASDAYSYFFDYPVLHQGNWRSSGQTSLALGPAC